MKNSDWSVCGLCVTARPEDLVAVRLMLDERPGVEVHASDPDSGRLIVVQEGLTVEEHQVRLREIQALPGVLTADLVIHYRDAKGILESPPPGGA